jgi:hypothetical protein
MVPLALTEANLVPLLSSDMSIVAIYANASEIGRYLAATSDVRRSYAYTDGERLVTDEPLEDLRVVTVGRPAVLIKCDHDVPDGAFRLERKEPSHG